VQADRLTPDERKRSGCTHSTPVCEHDVLGNLVVRNALVELFEEHAELHARKVGSEAPVEATGEGDMRVRTAVQLDSQGVLERVRIEVLHTDVDVHHRIWRNLLAIREFQFGRRIAALALHRRLPTQQLLDRSWPQLRSLD